MKRMRMIAAFTALLALSALALGNAQAADVYVGGGTVVFKQEGQAPAADKGTLVCSSSGVSVGGGCIPFGGGGFVAVTDLINGTNVAFQVCIDASGDGVCTDGKTAAAGQCNDIVFFSHDDEGLFHNPIGPLPGAMPTGCGQSAPWQGYVVFLCEGVHATGGPSTGAPGGGHAHGATLGTIATTSSTSPSGFGNFCGTGGGREPVSKPYVVAG